VYDNVVISPHGPDGTRVVDYMNGVLLNIHFATKMAKDSYLAFLDIDIYRRPAISLSQGVP
jgi:hypothetical protein